MVFSMFASIAAVVVDAGKVRLGGFAPTLAPTADAAKVHPGEPSRRRWPRPLMPPRFAWVASPRR